MADEKLLRKIKKLLALSTSSNPHEAAKALEMAQKLMAEHQLNQVDIDVTSHNSKQKFAFKTAVYVHRLIAIIKKAFGVECYLSNHYGTDDSAENKMHVVFYGLEERPVIASYCFDVLYRQLQRARKEFIATQSKRLKRSTLIARADSFCEGWVIGVHGNVKAFALNEQEQKKMTEYREKLKKQQEMKPTDARPIGNTREEGDLSRYQGYQQGRKVKLNHGVNGKETAKLGK